MLGFILAASSSFFGEISDVIGKQKMREGKVSVWTTGFLTLIFGVIFFLATAFIRGGFHFSIFLLQACVNGLASAVGGFAYLFIPPSVVIAISRGGAVLFSTISGSFYFKEKKRLFKFAVAFEIVAGLVFLV